MASSLEEWEARADIDWSDTTEDDKIRHFEVRRCISDLRDTLLVMEAEEVRKCATPRE